VNKTLNVTVQAIGFGKIEIKLAKGTDIESLLKQLFEQHSDSLSKFINPKSGKIYSFVSIWINSKSIKQLKDTKTNLKDGDVITIFRPSAGG
jgi:molybdopterin converting factor small subunit